MVTRMSQIMRRMSPFLLLVLIFTCAAAMADPTEAMITSPAGNITVATNQSISFNFESWDSQGRDGFQTNYAEWDFGDGTRASVWSTSHAYSRPGTYYITLTVSYSYPPSSDVPPDGPIAYIQGTARAYRTITVIDPPQITSFTSNVSSIRAGLPVTLSWAAQGATSLTISGIGAVSGTSKSVTPTGPATTYTLTASNAVGSVNASVTVNVYTLSVGISPSSASLLFGGSQAFTATVSPANQGVTWSASGGTLSGSTFTGNSAGTFTVTATSQEDPSKSASAVVTVSGVSISGVSPQNASVNAGDSLQFSASVSGAANASVAWSVSGGGTINASGVFVADKAGTYLVRATSHADSTKTSDTWVTVNSVVSGVAVTPGSIALKAGESTTFVAQVSGLGGQSTAVTWSTTGGSITSGGVYTAPIAGGSYAVTAKSVQDGNKAGSATVAVSGVSISAVSPQNPSVNAGGSLQFYASISGAVNAGLSWSVSGGGTINASGVFVADKAGTYLVRATSHADSTKTSDTWVTVNSVVSGVAVTPGSIALKAGESTTFVAQVSGLGGQSTAVTWSATGGSITSGGVYTAPIAGGVMTVTAKSVQDANKAGSATVSVASVTVSKPSPLNATVNIGGTIQYTSVVGGAVNTNIDWSVSGGGSISTTGLFKAAEVGIFTVKAASHADPTKSDTTVVTVTSGITSVSVSPGNIVVNPGEVLKFSAVVQGPSVLNPGIAWSASGGDIKQDGIFTAPNEAGSYTLTAKSQQDGSVYGVAYVRVKGWTLKHKTNILYVGNKEVAEINASGTWVTLVDHLGTPRITWDGTPPAGGKPDGVHLIQQKFLPFGESLIAPAESAKFTKGFTNHEQTDASGLIYMQARFYAPWYGRFLSPDPARDQHFEQTQSWNIYSYVQNNPTMMMDPTGEVAQIAINGNNVTITVPVRFGAGTSPEMRARFVDSVQSRWSGNFGAYKVTTTVVEGGKVDGQTNTVNFYDSPNGRSQVDEKGSTASIFTKEYAAGPVNTPNPATQEAAGLDETMAHEAGHLMNIADGYHDVSNWSKDGKKLEVTSVPNDRNTQAGVPADAKGKRSNNDLMVNDRNPKAKPTQADIKEATINKRNIVKKDPQ